MAGVFSGDRKIFTIIGVAEDVHITALYSDPPPLIITPRSRSRAGPVSGQLVSGSLAQRRFTLLFLAGFGLVSLVLAAIGL
ncbi:MAG: hypothetical protein JO159_04290 [Acidobacteria bacterium]|nr:hypothetical protein [Acidobacteriota bacterium]